MTKVAAQQQWNPLNDPIDYAVIAGRKTPGLCDIVGANSPRKWDEIEGYGLSGARLRFRGIGLSHFSIKLRLYDDRDWADWFAFRSIVAKPPLGKFAKAKKIVHPKLTEVGIEAMVVEDVLAPELTDETGEYTIEIKCIEFRLPKLALSTPSGAEATPVDPEEQIIGDLLKQNNELADEDAKIP